MRKFWLPLLLTPLMLAACDSQPLGEVDASSILDGLMKDKGGPEVKGVDATLLDSAQQAENKRQYSRALQFFQQLYDRDKNNPRFRLGLADNLRRTGQIDEAGSHYQHLLKADPANLDALEGKGLCLLARGEITGASDVFEKVMKQDRNRWRSLNAVGILFVMKGLPKEASVYYAEAAKLKPGEPAILNNYGLSLALEQKYTQAAAALVEAGEGLDKSDPEKRRADLNLALVYGLSGDMERAEEVAGRHLKESALNNNLGFYAYLADNQELAKAYLNNALAGSPVFYEKAWKNLEIVGGSKVERSQLGSDSENASFRQRFNSKVPFEEFSREEVVTEEAPVAAPVTPVANTPDLPPVIEDRPAPVSKTVVAPEEKVEKITLTPPIVANPKDNAKVEVFPAMPVAPLLDGGIRPVSMVTPVVQPAAGVYPQQAPMPTPVFTTPPPRMDIYLPSEMGGEKVRQQIKKDLAEKPLMPDEAKKPEASPSHVTVDNSHMLVFQAGASSSASSAAASSLSPPPEKEEPELTENPAQPPVTAAPKAPVMVNAREKGGIVGTPVPEYQDPASPPGPERESTVDYIKSIF